MNIKTQLIMSIIAVVIAGTFAVIKYHRTHEKPAATRVETGNGLGLVISNSGTIFGASGSHEVSQGLDSLRYFLVGYETQETKYSSTVYGNISFSIKGGFFSKTFLDSIVYSQLDKKAECYADIVIRSVFEFKNRTDFHDYNVGYRRTPVKKKKAGCCWPMSADLDMTGYPKPGNIISSFGPSIQVTPSIVEDSLNASSPVDTVTMPKGFAIHLFSDTVAWKPYYIKTKNRKK